MKSRNRANYLIAIGVILCSATLLGALTFALTGFSLPKGGRKVMIDFHDATGIKLHSEVRFAGKVAGHVAEIRYLTATERKSAKDSRNAVRVAVQLDDDVPPILTDVNVSLTAETLLGEKFIALMPGRPDAAPLADGAIIQGTEVSSIDSLTRSGQALVENVNDIILNLKADYPGLIPRLRDLLAQGNGILVQGSNFVKNVDNTITNANEIVTQLKSDYSTLIPKLSGFLTQAQGIATNASVAVEKISALIDRLDGVVKTNEGDLEKIVDELRVSVQNLKVITTYTKSLTATLAERPSSLIWSRKKHELPNEIDILESTNPVPLIKPR